VLPPYFGYTGFDVNISIGQTWKRWYLGIPLALESSSICFNPFKEDWFQKICAFYLANYSVAFYYSNCDYVLA
jgi:hypothetical protein